MANDKPNFNNMGDQLHDEEIEIYLEGQLYSKGINFNNIQQQTLERDKFERFYRSVFIAVERRPEDPNVEKEQLFFMVERIYEIVMNLNGFSKDFDFLGRSLKQLFSLAPDVFQVCVTILTNPSSELDPELVQYVEKVRQECMPMTNAASDMPIHTYLEKELMNHHLPLDKSNEMREDLEELQAAVNDGNVRPVRKLLDELLGELPGMRQPLRHWLVESAEVPPTIKVFARKYLA